jgi:hypothetical protein
MNVTEEQKNNTIGNSTERSASKDFPEYSQFFTGEVEYRKALIVNSINEQRIDVLVEAKSGGLGDVIDVYFKLKKEEAFDESFLGKLMRVLTFRNKRYPWDRAYLLSGLKSALNHITLRW